MVNPNLSRAQFEENQHKFEEVLLNTKVTRTPLDTGGLGWPREMFGHFLSEAPNGVRTTLTAKPVSERIPLRARATPTTEVPPEAPDSGLDYWKSDKSALRGGPDPASLSGGNRTHGQAMYAVIAALSTIRHPHLLLPYMNYEQSPPSFRLAQDMDAAMGTKQAVPFPEPVVDDDPDVWHPIRRPIQPDEGEEWFKNLGYRDQHWQFTSPEEHFTVAHALRDIYAHPKLDPRVKQFVMDKTGITPERLAVHFSQ